MHLFPKTFTQSFVKQMLCPIFHCNCSLVRKKPHCSLPPLLPSRVVLRFWSPRDLAFYIPGIPTSVPPRLLIIAACSLHNHFTAREERGSPSEGRKMRHVWLEKKNLMEIVELLWILHRDREQRFIMMRAWAGKTSVRFFLSLRLFLFNNRKTSHKRE